MPNVSTPPSIDNLKKYFSALCEANALLWKLDEIELHEAVDKLQAYAEPILIRAIGQDAVQLMMHHAFKQVRDQLGRWPR